MRKFTMIMLFATIAVPAMAAAQDGGWHRGRQSASEQSDNRPAREARAERPERAQQNAQREQMQAERQAQIQQMQAARQGQVQQIQQQQQLQQVERQRQTQVEGQAGERGRQFIGRDRRAAGGQSRDEQMQQYRAQMEARRAQAAGQQVQTQGGLVERDGRYRSVPNINPNVVGRPAPENREARFASRDRRDTSRWTNNWRNDNRYDWRRYRDQHRSTFRIGLYFDPFGYSYNRFGIGSYMYPGYYQSNYWINDPWQYRLPPAYGPYRWIRYHNDALMIDTWTGEVVDVIYGFFW